MAAMTRLADKTWDRPGAHLADEAVAVLGVGDDGGGGAAALCVGDDGGGATLHGGDLVRVEEAGRGVSSSSEDFLSAASAGATTQSMDKDGDVGGRGVSRRIGRPGFARETP